MTNFQKFALAFIVVVWSILAIGFSYKIGRKVGYRHGYEDALANIRPDTEYVDKPIYIDRPIPVEVIPAGKEMYPIGTVAEFQRIVDSLAAVKPDTTVIEIPIQMETKTYRDSSYEAQVSGYHPSLDWIKINQRTAYITVPVPEYQYPKFMLSPAISAMALPKDFFAGAGIEADFWSNRWQFSIEGGYGINFGSGWNTHGLYGAGKVKYNLIRR